MNKPVYLELSILELIKILTYEFSYDYIKQKYSEGAKLCYMDTDNFIVYRKTDDTCKDIEEDVKTTFDTSNYELDRPVSKGKNKELIGLMKDELGGIIMIEFVGLRAKPHSYLKDDDSEDRKSKERKNCVIKRKLKFENYKNCLEANHLQNKINHLKK